MAKPLFIIGSPASGKSTFGKALARAIGRQFIDLDNYIENRFRTTISEIFANRGEEEFRLKERVMLLEAGEFENVVIACGGGTPCFFDNMEWMLAHGMVVWIETSPECLVRRAMRNSRRPMFKGLNAEETALKIKELLALRSPIYSKAHIRFSGEELENRTQISASIERFLSATKVFGGLCDL